MEIASYESYEQEKKQNEGKPIGQLYYQVYKLGAIGDRYYNWKYTNYLFANTDEKVVFYFHYITQGQTARGGHGKIEYDFYVIEDNGEYYIRYFDMRGLKDKASECGKQAIINLGWSDEALVGVTTPEYRDFVRENAMSEKIPIGKAELEEKLNAIQQIDFDSVWCTLHYLDYLYAATKVEMLDFRNKIAFNTDEYVLPVSAPFINLMEFVFDKCNIPHLEKCNLKYIDSIEEAIEIIIDETIKKKYGIL